MKQKLSRPKNSFARRRDGFKSLDHVLSCVLNSPLQDLRPSTHLETGDYM